MIYSEELLNSIKDILVENQQTIAIAESVTSGNLQAAFSVQWMPQSTFREALPHTTWDKKHGI